MATTRLISPLSTSLSSVPHSQQSALQTSEIGAGSSNAAAGFRSSLFGIDNNAFCGRNTPTTVRFMTERVFPLQSSFSSSRKTGAKFSTSASISPGFSASHDHGIGCLPRTANATSRLYSRVDSHPATLSRFESSRQLGRKLKTFQCRAQGGAGNDENAGSLSKTTLRRGRVGILPSGWRKVGLTLFGSGFLLGPLLDAIHSRVGVQVYDNGAVDLLGFHTNIWVFPMLGVFYSVVGLLQLALDRKFAPRGNLPTASLTTVAATFIALVLLLELSSELYAASVPFNIEAYILFFGAEFNWVLFDNTWWGFALAALSGTGCPALEIPIIKYLGLWHYPQANIFLFGQGSISWVICAYFFYTPFVGNLARWLLAVYQTQEASERLRS